MRNRKTLIHEEFLEFPVGPLPTDFTAAGEYHTLPMDRGMGIWHEPMRGDWRPNSPWVVVEDEGAHRLLQTADESSRGPRILVAGDPAWKDYHITARLQTLKTNGSAGVLFRYETSRHHLGVAFEGGNGVVLFSRTHDDTTRLVRAEFALDCSKEYRLDISMNGMEIRVKIDGAHVFTYGPEANAGGDPPIFPRGRIALYATTTCFFSSIGVTQSEEEHHRDTVHAEERRNALAKQRELYPKPELWRRIDTKGYGTGRQIRFGHLSATGQLDILLAQNLKLLSGGDSYTTIRCLTAINLAGDVLWQWGEPSESLDAALVTCDLPVQIYDIDGDGQDEVICLKNFRLYVLDGRTGEVKNQRDLPLNPKEEHQFGRLLGDAIIIANLRGTSRPADIIIKNRYRQIWAFDQDLNELWTREFDTFQTGHFAQPYDFNGDGRDELYIGYCLLGSDGSTIWTHEWEDHTDEIAIGRFDPRLPDPQIAVVAGEAGFAAFDMHGKVLFRNRLGHAQRLTAAKIRSDLAGIQFAVITYWGHAGIVSIHDCRGSELLHFEPTTMGVTLGPVNWDGSGAELLLLNGSPSRGGMIDGHGRRVVLFPDDGHPEMCCEALDLAGDRRDEIVLWDKDSIWIYTQEDTGVETGADSMYAPIRYPHYNSSNYRAEISLPE
jgi:rhamnogalacturonan endolyase